MPDAIKAGEGAGNFIGNLASNFALPFFLWFYVVPTIFGSKKEQVDPNVVVEPTTWTYSILRFVLIIAGIMVFMLVMIVVRQESMLFVPGQPF